MLGVSRVGYSLATNRQIPQRARSAQRSVGHADRGHRRGLARRRRAGRPPRPRVADRDLRVRRAVAFTIAHLSVIRLRIKDPDRERAYRVPLSVPFRGASIPVPAVLGALVSVAGLISVLIYHSGARWVGIGWLFAGLVLYVTYRTDQGKPLLKRVTIPERALKREAPESEFGSILVPIFGSALDDDIVQTAGRLAGETHDDVEEEGAVIEAIWVFEIPLSLPLDAAAARRSGPARPYRRSPAPRRWARSTRASRWRRRPSARRRAGAAIVARGEAAWGRGDRARRGGALAGPRRRRCSAGPRPLDNYVGEVTKYVINKAPCRVILTAPPANWQAKFDT